MVLAVAGSLALPACGDDSPFRRPDPRIREPSEAPSPLTPSSSSIPQLSCVDSVAYDADLWEVAAVVPPEFRRRSRPRPQDAGWLPASLSDVAALDDGYVVVDRGSGEVTRFNQDFTQRKQWGGKGAGPGEFVEPVAVTVSPNRKLIWVLDEFRIAAFDRDGAFVRSSRLPGTGIGLAIDESGTIYVAHAVVSDLVHRDAIRFGAVVTMYDSDGTNRRELIGVTPADLEPPRYVLPLVTRVRVVARGSRLAVIYMSAGVVDVFQDGEHIGTIQACMPDALAKAYERQLERGGDSQGTVNLVSDVFLDADGTIHLVSPLKDEQGRYHIDRFSSTGQQLGSIVMSGEHIRLPIETRFGSSPLRLVAFDVRGVVGAFEVRPRETGPASRRP